MRVRTSKSGTFLRFVMTLGALMGLLAFVALFTGNIAGFFALLLLSAVVYFGAKGLLWISTGEKQSIDWYEK